MKRLADIAMATIVAILLFPVILVVALTVRATSPGPILYWSDRVGKDGILFRMPKFRTMKVGTPVVATHLIDDPRAVLTAPGSFLRQTSLDEIPQLISVLLGDMSFVGPRPALFNQADLIALRQAAGVDRLRPGITGWAQINGRDELPIADKVIYDREYLLRRSFLFDARIILRTAAKLIGDRSVTH